MKKTSESKTESYKMYKRRGNKSESQSDSSQLETQKTDIIQDFLFYENGKIVKINVENMNKEKYLDRVFKSLLKNKNLNTLYVPKNLFDKKEFQDFFYNDLFTKFFNFDMKQDKTKHNLIITKKTITTGKYIVVPYDFFYDINKSINTINDIKSNKNLEYIYVDKYLGFVDATKKYILEPLKKLGYNYKTIQFTRNYHLFKISKK
jgi:hypothetical protein